MAETNDASSRPELEARIDELQRRIEQLEARLQTRAPEAAVDSAVAPPMVAVPLSPAPVITAPQAPPPAAPAPTYWNTPTASPQAPPPIAPPAAAPAPTYWFTQESKPPGPSIVDRLSQGGIEDLLTGRVLAWVGGAALIAGAVLFLSLAFSRGWIGPELRVILGLIAGGVALGIGAWLFAEVRQRAVAHVLVAVGLGITSVALIAATRLYDLVPVEVGLAGSLVIAIVAAAIAIRANSQTVAGFGLLAVLAAPPTMGASPDLVTVAFLATALVGTTIIALFRAWPILPAIAFLLSAPQLASWLVDDAIDVRVGLVVLWSYWLINEIAAGGEEVIRRSRVLRPASATLVVANAAFLVAGGYALLDGTLEVYRGAFLAAVALVHFVIGAWFLRAEGDRHLFGLLVTGTGLAALTIAVPVQFGAPVVPIAWAAEAVALVWIRVRRDHLWSGLAAIVLGALAVGHLVLLEMPMEDYARLSRPDIPFSDPAGLAALFVVAALALSAWILRVRWERAGVITVAVLLTVYVIPFELIGVAVLVAWAALAVGTVGLDVRWLNVGRPPWSVVTARTETVLPELLESSVWFAGAVAFAAAVAHALVVELPVKDVLPTTLPAIPFVDAGGVAILALVAALGAIGVIDTRPGVRAGCALLAGGIVAYGVIFEVPLAAVPVIWSGLAVVYAQLAAERPDDEVWWRYASDTLIGLGFVLVLVFVARPDRLVVDADRASPAIPFVNGATVALGSLAAALLAIVWIEPRQRRNPIRQGIAAITLVYLLSIGVVDLFQARLSGATAEEELAKQAQVALSVLWGILGAGAFAFGLMTDRPRARQAGLVMLAVVTVKVVLVDLAALDVAYRVLSLLALGIVLLASAYLSGRFRHSSPTV